MRSPLAFLLSLPVRFYRRIISPLKPKTCRFEPTCSSYALEALHRHGGFKGSWLTAKRLCRCHPFCEPGFDPVPPRSQPAATDDEGRHPKPDARTDVTPHPSSDLDQA